MSLLWNIVIVVSTISLFTFAAFFGRLPAFRKTPIGFLYRSIWIYIPNILNNIDQRVTGGRLAGSASRSWNKLLYEKHPVVLLFFLSLLTGCVLFFVPAAWPHLPLFHKLLIPILVPQPYLFTYLCNISTANSPHIVTHVNISDNLQRYPYDYKLFQPALLCRTCKLPKPARSKHCSICNACVARADHHCVWVNNCLGRGNYKWFLALLLSTHVLLAYGAYLAYVVLQPQIAAHFAAYPDYHHMEYADMSGLAGWALNWGEYLLDVLATSFFLGGASVGGVGFLALLTAPLPLGLLAYHIYLIWAGMTTNESGKWSDWKEDMADGLVWIAEFDAGGSWGHGYEDPAGESGRGDMEMDVLSSWKRSGWPRRSDQFLALTSDGQYPRQLQREIMEVVGAAPEWKRVRRLKYVDNIYDLGFWENLRHVLQD